MSQVVIVSGPSGAGKSAACEALCERYDRTVHLRTDEFFASIRMGFVKPWEPASDRQNRMVTTAIARAASAYVEELYAVFIDGVIGPHLLPIYVDELARTRVPVHFALLLPDVEETLRRVDAREQARMPLDAHRRLHAQFVAYGPFAGCTIDNTRLSAQATADRIMDACGQGTCLVSASARV